MALVDQIISAESGGNPNARNPHSSAGGALRPPHVSDEFGAYALVSKLHLASGPSAVLWGVIAVIIDPIKGVFCTWARPHVGKEVLKAGRPSVTNSNAPSTIVFVRSVFWQFTSSLHAAPYLVFCRRLATARNRYGHSVRTIGDFRRINLITTAATGIPGLKVRDRNGGDVPAVAAASHSPYRRRWSIFPEFWFSFGNSQQPAEFQADVIYAWGH